MGKRSSAPGKHRRRTTLRPALIWGGVFSLVVLFLTVTLAISGTPVSTTPTASESLPTLAAPSTVARSVSVAPRTLSAPTTAASRVLPQRISAIHIERPTTVTVTTVVPETTTETETITVAPAEAEERVVRQARPARPSRSNDTCLTPKGDYGGVKPYVGIIGAHVQHRFGVERVVGKAGRANASEHPRGLALDFMTNTGDADGDAIAAYLISHSEDFGVKYVIWQQQIIFPGKSPRDMEDRGSDTANHKDHVHLSMNSEPGPVTPTC